MYSVDLTLYHIDGFIITDVYSKPTDSHLYLPPSSCHPKHVFKAIPFGVATRLKRNCSDETFFAERTAEYKGYLLNQGYPSTISRLVQKKRRNHFLSLLLSIQSYPMWEI